MGKNQKENKPMSLKKKILSVVLKTFLALLAVALVCITVFAVLFWDTFVNIVKNPAMIPYAIENWDAFSKGLKVSTTELEADQRANTEYQVKAFSEANISLNEDDISNLSRQDISEEERTEIIYNAIISGNADFGGTADSADNGNDTAEKENGKPDDGNAGDKVNGDKKEDDGGENRDEEKEEPENDGSDGKENVKKEDSPDTKKEEAKPAPDEKPKDEEKTDNKQKEQNSDHNNDGQSGVGESGAENTDPLIVKPSYDKPLEYVPPKNNTQPEKETPAKPSDNGTANSGNASGKLSEEQYNMRIAELVARMYSIKADFVSQLASFESSVIAQYKALPAEQRTTATKSRIVSENMNYIMGLEAQCDAQVAAVTSELTAIMTANGKSTALVDQINTAYINEKENKKAYYVSLYK